MYESSSIIEARLHACSDGEAERAAIVDKLGLVHASSTSLDIVALRAARVMQTSLGAVTVLVRDEQHVIASTGIDTLVSGRATSLCTHVTARRTPLTIRDATRSPYFAGNPMVGFGARSIRAYCGVPIMATSEAVVAVLCTIDPRPRMFDRAQVAALEGLADTARAILLPMLAAPPTRARPSGFDADENSSDRVEPDE